LAAYEMNLLVSIVSWNCSSLLQSCLRSILANSTTAPEILVIDNASADGTPQMVRREYPSVSLLETGANLGFGRAHNLAATRSAKYILFLNPDTIFSSPAHEEMCALLDSMPDVGMVGCRMVNPDGSVQPLGIQRGTSLLTEAARAFSLQRWPWFQRRFLPRQNPDVSAHVEKLYGGAIMVRREVLNAVGWFDERFFMYAEDVDLSRRLRAAGWKLYYSAEISILHVGGGSSARAPSTFAAVMQAHSVALLLRKYYGPITPYLYRLAVGIGGGLRLLAVVFKRLFEATGAIPSSADRRKRASNYSALLLWALGLKRAQEP
jgi:GT2 family glycosyltransferase